MDVIDVMPMLDNLTENIDELEEVLAPLLNTNLAEITSKLPLLDRAKLNVLVTYGVESIIFAYLKLNGIDAKEHPVFRELARVKQYFEKIKESESKGSANQPSLQLDKGAAGRFIKSALAGNDEYDRKRTEQQKVEKGDARQKFESMSDQVGTAQRFKHLSLKRGADDIESSADPLATSAPLPSLPPTSSPNSDNVESPEAAQQKSSDLDRKTKRRRSRKHALSKAQTSSQTNSSALPQSLEETVPSKTDFKHVDHSDTHHKSKKSHKIPKSSNMVFQELLHKPRQGNQKHEPEKD